MYAEDWIYAPAVAKTVEILKATERQNPVHEGGGEPLLACRACCAQWAMTGGGSCSHPDGDATSLLLVRLILKQVEARACGQAY